MVYAFVFIIKKKIAAYNFIIDSFSSIFHRPNGNHFVAPIGHYTRSVSRFRKRSVCNAKRLQYVLKITYVKKSNTMLRDDCADESFLEP